MKVLCVKLIILFLLQCPGYCKILNGYEKDIEQAIRELKFMHALKNGEIHFVDGTEEWDRLSAAQKILVNKKIAALQETIQYFLLTECMLTEFQLICPEIYKEIDEIQNFESQETDVYVKIIPNYLELSEVSGATILSQDLTNPHSSISKFGPNSVEINVCTSKSALKILAHELGHVQFAIPHLAQYVKYCQRRYRKDLADPNAITFNHQASDMGSKSVIDYECRFKRAYKAYLKNPGNELFHPKKILKEMDITMYLEESLAALHPNSQDDQ